MGINNDYDFNKYHGPDIYKNIVTDFRQVTDDLIVVKIIKDDKELFYFLGAWGFWGNTRRLRKGLYSNRERVLTNGELIALKAAMIAMSK
tara:strand:- start:178 stop:447 length:270 start_codon:yes stop_codon:yes gene_type:complete